MCKCGKEVGMQVGRWVSEWGRGGCVSGLDSVRDEGQGECASVGRRRV